MDKTLMHIEVLRVNGTREQHDIPKRNAIRTIHRLIDCEVGDSVNLRDGRVMCVDDSGMLDGKPINEQATKLYHSIYRTPYSIHGDVAIAVDEDFA